LATLPITLSVFQSVSLISPLAHVVAMPLLAPVLLGAALLALSAPVPPLAGALAWLAWWPTARLVETVRIAGSVPAAALSTGQLPPLGALVLAALLLGWGLWPLPELAALRRRMLGDGIAGTPPGRAAPLAAAGLSVLGLLLLVLVRPDGLLHVDRLDVAPGEAVLIRGPTGRKVLVARGRLDGFRLAGQVGGRLAVWEHGLYAVVSLDADAEARVTATLERYPAEQHLDGYADQRLDLGAGAVLDIYASSVQPAAAVSFGPDWEPIVGHPPPPDQPSSGQAGPLLQPDQHQKIEHDHAEDNDQLHPFADDHR
jgi:hypothetical protein